MSTLFNSKFLTTLLSPNGHFWSVDTSFEGSLCSSWHSTLTLVCVNFVFCDVHRCFQADLRHLSKYVSEHCMFVAIFKLTYDTWVSMSVNFVCFDVCGYFQAVLWHLRQYVSVNFVICGVCGCFQADLRHWSQYVSVNFVCFDVCGCSEADLRHLSQYVCELCNLRRLWLFSSWLTTLESVCLWTLYFAMFGAIFKLYYDTWDSMSLWTL